MLKELLILGIFDRTPKQQTNSLQDYIELLEEYREYEAEILIKIAILSYEEDDVEEALAALEKARVIYDEMGFEEKKADVLSLIGDIYLAVNEKKAALEYYHQCMDLYSKVDSEYKDEVYKKIRDIEGDLSTKDRIKEKLKKGEQIGVPSEVDTGKTDEYAEIFEKLEEIINLLEESRVYHSYLHDEITLSNINEAYNMASDLGDKKTQGVLLLIIGDKTLYEKKTEESLEIFNKALDLFLETEYPKGEAVSRLFIGVASFLLDDVGNIKYNFRKAVEIFRSLKDSHAESIAVGLLNVISEI